MGGFRANVNVGRIVDPYSNVRTGISDLTGALSTFQQNDRQRQKDLGAALKEGTKLAKDRTIRDTIGNVNDQGGVQLGLETQQGLNSLYGTVNEDYESDMAGLKTKEANLGTLYDGQGNVVPNADITEERNFLTDKYNTRIGALNEQTQARYKQTPDFLDTVTSPKDAEQRLAKALMVQGIDPTEARTQAAAELKPYYAPDISERQKLQIKADQKRIEGIRDSAGSITSSEYNRTGSYAGGSSGRKGGNKKDSFKAIDDVGDSWYKTGDERAGVLGSDAFNTIGLGDSAGQASKKIRGLANDPLFKDVPLDWFAAAADKATEGVNDSIKDGDRRINEDKMRLNLLRFIKDGGPPTSNNSGGAGKSGIGKSTGISTTQKAPLSKLQQDEVASLNARIDSKLSGGQATVKGTLGEALTGINDTRYNAVAKNPKTKPDTKTKTVDKYKAYDKVPGIKKAMSTSKEGALAEALLKDPEKFVKGYDSLGKGSKAQKQLDKVLANNASKKVFNTKNTSLKKVLKSKDTTTVKSDGKVKPSLNEDSTFSVKSKNATEKTAKTPNITDTFQKFLDGDTSTETVDILKKEYPKLKDYNINKKRAKKAQAKANQDGFSTWTDTKGNKHQVTESGLEDTTLDFVGGKVGSNLLKGRKRSSLLNTLKGKRKLRDINSANRNAFNLKNPNTDKNLRGVLDKSPLVRNPQGPKIDVGVSTPSNVIKGNSKLQTALDKVTRQTAKKVKPSTITQADINLVNRIAKGAKISKLSKPMKARYDAIKKAAEDRNMTIENYINATRTKL